MSNLIDMIHKCGGIDDLAKDVLHGSSFLMDDIERGLDTGRAKKLEGGGYQFIFQESGIDDTLWLMGKVWNQVRDLHGLLVELRNYVEEHEDALNKALPEEKANG